MIPLLFSFLVLQFTWDAPPDSQVDSYRVYKITGTTTKKVAEVKRTAYKLSNPALGVASYYVTAVNKFGESDKSNVVKIQVEKSFKQME